VLAREKASPDKGSNRAVKNPLDSRRAIANIGHVEKAPPSGFLAETLSGTDPEPERNETMSNVASPEDRLQRELDLTAPATDSQAPIVWWRGIYWQHIPGVNYACGVHDAAEFAAEWGEPVTHEAAQRIIAVRLHPLHPEHHALMDAMRSADEQFARDEQESRWADLAEDRAMERGL